MLVKQALTLQTVKKNQKTFWQMPTHSTPFMATFFNCSSLHGNHSSIIISFTFSFFSPSGLHSVSLYLAMWCSVRSSWYLSVFFSKQPLLHTLNKLDRSYLPGSLRRETNLPNAIWRHHTSPCTIFLFLKISGGSFEVPINSSLASLTLQMYNFWTTFSITFLFWKYPFQNSS